ncbi:Protein SSH4 OS=Coccidioides immitis (strain RS) GN=SSH4 PE=3 SV=1 [Rhizoctonia solani AG-1 IB]|uniref:Protein SSH4 n=1 Tax=Thanatephorus cucumeris (strain AG1-IB / isolate 7/3/14) TaxID=1108050 RepID=A0A0B7FJ94_THACB|nr:Protein SSH4 OS=Coccidioides immitis (strain RS) GN=SSH4 PE=3 SV=1 [Rhizoctonia solani AG-1 IB]
MSEQLPTPGPSVVVYTMYVQAQDAIESGAASPGPVSITTRGGGQNDALLVLLPLLIVLSCLLFLLLFFLVFVLLFRRRRSIALGDRNGPVDMSREDFSGADGGFEGLEQRWLDGVSDMEQRQYHRVKEYQQQFPPNSQATDITLSQFLTIQEKGVSAWSFEPDYESGANLLVHARTELTFLSDPFSATSVQSNLPLPKLNEVYYWEVKMFDLPATTNIAIGLATKPFPSFSMPGHARQSLAYLSSGERCHNYPFTVTSCGPPLIEGDVLGIGYRPRTGSAFFTRNGRRLEDAFTGLGRWNLFPTIGADGPCSLHVNLGQAGFVFIEANVKKWGLAPSVGTLAPPPAYGSERGSILLEAGGAIIRTDDGAEGTSFGSTGSPGYRTPTTRRTTRHHPHASSSSVPSHPSPLRTGRSVTTGSGSGPAPPAAPSSSLTPTIEEPETDTDAEDERTPRPAVSDDDAATSTNEQDENAVVLASPPVSPNPPTPRVTDIHLRPLNLSSGSGNNTGSGASVPALSPRTLAALAPPGPPPPEYSPLDVNRYPNGVALDLPADVIAAALDGPSRRH